MPLRAISTRAAALYLPSMLAPLLLLASTLNPPPAPDPVRELSKGSALYRVCQAEIRLMNLPSLTKASQSDLLNGSYCVGYLNGFVANAEIKTTICPESAPMGDLVRAYVHFLDKNPNLLGQDRRLGLGLALEEAFPCPTKRTPGINQAGLASVTFPKKP